MCYKDYIQGLDKIGIGVYIELKKDPSLGQMERQNITLIYGNFLKKKSKFDPSLRILRKKYIPLLMEFRLKIDPSLWTTHSENYPLGWNGLIP